MIYDENEEEVYMVKATDWWGRKFIFFNIDDVELFQFNRKPWSWKPTFEVFHDDQLIATITRPHTFFKKQLQIETSLTEPFIAEGNVWGNEYKFIRDEEEIGAVSKKLWSWKDTYGVVINEGENDELLLTLVIIFDVLAEQESGN